MADVDDWLPPGLLLAYFGALGAVVGSFLNVVIARLPEEQSIVHPRSRCPRCRTPIAWFDNVPVLSFLVLRGRCRHCGQSISMRYPLIELLMAALSLALVVRFGLSWDLLIWGPLAACLLAITFLDIDHWWVPDVIVLPAMAWAAAGSFLPGGIAPLEALWGVGPALGLWALAWLFERATGREGMGFGDIKLLALIGMAVGPLGAATVLVLGSFQGAAVGIVVMLLGGHPGAQGSPNAGTHDNEQPSADPAEDADAAEGDTEEDAEGDDWKPHPRAIPFGPFLALGAFEVVLLPEHFGGFLIRLTATLAGWLA